MRTKSFFADSVAAAMWQARHALGEDALLVTSRLATKERRQHGAYEVVVGVRSPGEPRAPQYSEDRPGALVGRVLSFRTAPPSKWPPRLKRLHAKLIDFEFEKSLADVLSRRVASRLEEETVNKGRTARGQPAASQAPIVQRIIDEELDGFFPREIELEGPAAGKILALFGPPGVGKTSAAVRLAVRHGVAHGKRTLLVAASDDRVAADSRLARYAELLDAEYRLADSVHGLETALADRGKDVLILIDTPGLTRQDLESAQGLAAFLARRKDVQRHLVLPATMKLSDLREHIRLFSSFGTQRLLFTKLDETPRFGPVLSVAVESGLPISFFTHGQQLPGNVFCASSLGLSRRVAELGEEEKSPQPRNRRRGRQARRRAVSSRGKIRQRRERRGSERPLTVVHPERGGLRDAG